MNISLIDTFLLTDIRVSEGDIPPISELPHLTTFHVDLSFGVAYTRELFTAISSHALSSLALERVSRDVIDSDTFVGSLRNPSQQQPEYPTLRLLELGYAEYKEIPRNRLRFCPGYSVSRSRIAITWFRTSPLSLEGKNQVALWGAPSDVLSDVLSDQGCDSERFL